MGMDPNRTIPKDDSGGTNYAKIAPATAILNVAADAELERPFQDAAVNGEKLAAKNTSYEGITTLTSADGQTTYKEVPKYHRDRARRRGNGGRDLQQGRGHPSRRHHGLRL